MQIDNAFTILCPTKKEKLLVLSESNKYKLFWIILYIKLCGLFCFNPKVPVQFFYKVTRFLSLLLKHFVLLFSQVIKSIGMLSL